MAVATLRIPDPSAFASLRSRPISRAERMALGRRLRQQVPRSALGDWTAPTGRPDIVAQIMDSHEGRLERLIPVRVARMAASPYGFLRGAAVVMAEDLARLPATGIQPVICGDAHLGNFGFYASPERDLVIDLNDFDEAHPGGWEWDLRRLAASVWVAGRQNNLTEAAMRHRGHLTVGDLPGACPMAGRAAAVGPNLRPARHESATDHRRRAHPARRNRPGRDPGPTPCERPGAPPLHRDGRARAAHRRGTTTDHAGR